MKNFLKSLNFENILQTAKRFPLSFVYIFITASLCILLISEVYFGNENTLIKAVSAVITTFFLSLGFFLFSETEKLSLTKKYGLQALAILFGIIYYFYFIKTYEAYSFIIFFGILIFFFFAAFLKEIFSKNYQKHHYHAYLVKMTEILLTALIIGFITSILGFIALHSIFYLFDIHNWKFTNKLVGYWVVFSSVLFAPIFALTKIPKNLKNLELQKNILGFFILNYIAIPAIFIYFLILYAYSIKVLGNFSEWPKGEVSWMVIAFSSFGYLIYMFSEQYGNENKFISLFRKYFPFVVIPQIFMLFYAIYLRISQYDLTMNRYLVVIFGIWLSLISLYFIISKLKKIAIIPALLTLFTLIISIGPWSVFELPVQRQFNRLQNTLKKENILVDGKIIYPKNSLNSEKSQEIYNQIRYNCQQKNCEQVKKLFAIDEAEVKKSLEYETERETVNSWEITNYLEKKLKLENKYVSASKDDFLNINKHINNINIKGYSNLERFAIYNEINNNTFKVKERNITLTKEQIETLQTSDDNKIMIGENALIIENLYYNRETHSLQHISGYFLTK